MCNITKQEYSQHVGTVTESPVIFGGLDKVARGAPDKNYPNHSFKGLLTDSIFKKSHERTDKIDTNQAEHIPEMVFRLTLSGPTKNRQNGDRKRIFIFRKLTGNIQDKYVFKKVENGKYNCGNPQALPHLFVKTPEINGAARCDNKGSGKHEEDWNRSFCKKAESLVVQYRGGNYAGFTIRSAGCVIRDGVGMDSDNEYGREYPQQVKSIFPVFH